MSFRFGQPFRHFQSVGSTMTEAAQWSEEGAPEGAVVVAERQTAGRGRLGRLWNSEAGVGLYFSIILRPRMSPADATLITLAMGLGAARGIGESCGRQCDIRWPNDVLLGDKKCCGILVEMNADQDRVHHVVAGVGINVNQELMPPELADTATSLRIETGCEFLRDVVYEAVLNHCGRYYQMFHERGPASVISAFARVSSYARGRAVVIEDGVEEGLCGVTAGLDPHGVLRVETADGRMVRVLAGSVRPAPKPEFE